MHSRANKPKPCPGTYQASTLHPTKSPLTAATVCKLGNRVLNCEVRIRCRLPSTNQHSHGPWCRSGNLHPGVPHTLSSGFDRDVGGDTAGDSGSNGCARRFCRSTGAPTVCCGAWSVSDKLHGDPDDPPRLKHAGLLHELRHRLCQGRICFPQSFL